MQKQLVCSRWAQRKNALAHLQANTDSGHFLGRSPLGKCLGESVGDSSMLSGGCHKSSKINYLLDDPMIPRRLVPEVSRGPTGDQPSFTAGSFDTGAHGWWASTGESAPWHQIGISSSAWRHIPAGTSRLRAICRRHRLAQERNTQTRHRDRCYAQGNDYQDLFTLPSVSAPTSFVVITPPLLPPSRVLARKNVQAIWL